MPQMDTSYSPALYALLHDVAVREPARVYYYCGQRAVAYATFDQQVVRLGQQLHSYTAASDVPVVAVSLRNPEAMLHMIWACLSARICLAFLPEVDDVTTLRRLMAQVKTAVLVTDQTAWQGEAGVMAYDTLFDAAMTATTTINVTPTDRDANAFLFQTSGTTGAAKWVQVTQSQCKQAVMAMQAADCLAHAVGQRVYITPPFSHSYGLSSLLEYTAVAATLVLPPEPSAFGPVGALLNGAVAEQVTALEGVAYFYEQMVRLARRLPPLALQHVGFGGGRINGRLVEQLHQRYPQLTYSVRYGMTETPSVISQKTFTMPTTADLQAAGKPLPIYEMRIVDEQRQPVVAGATGEIEIRGGCLAWPYYGEPANSDFFATGDMGYLNGEGELCIVGRKSLFLKVRGYRISPLDIEAAIMLLSEVVDCRVTAVADEVVAEIVSDDAPFSGATLRRFLADKVASYAVPKRITFVNEMPRTASGKIKRH